MLTIVCRKNQNAPTPYNKCQIFSRMIVGAFVSNTIDAKHSQCKCKYAALPLTCFNAPTRRILQSNSSDTSEVALVCHDALPEIPKAALRSVQSVRVGSEAVRRCPVGR